MSNVIEEVLTDLISFLEEKCLEAKGKGKKKPEEEDETHELAEELGPPDAILITSEDEEYEDEDELTSRIKKLMKQRG